MPLVPVEQEDQQTISQLEHLLKLSTCMVAAVIWEVKQHKVHQQYMDMDLVELLAVMAVLD